MIGSGLTLPTRTLSRAKRNVNELSAALPVPPAMYMQSGRSPVMPIILAILPWPPAGRRWKMIRA